MRSAMKSKRLSRLSPVVHRAPSDSLRWCPPTHYATYRSHLQRYRCSCACRCDAKRRFEAWSPISGVAGRRHMAGGGVNITSHMSWMLIDTYYEFITHLECSWMQWCMSVRARDHPAHARGLSDTLWAGRLREAVRDKSSPSTILHGLRWADGNLIA